MSEIKDRPYHHGDLRRALIDTALDMLATNQNWTFTLREVARRTGVSHAAPYKHFHDRETLLRELARIGFVQLGESLTEAVSLGQPSTRAQFVAAAQACIGFACQNPGLYRLMFSSDADKTIDPQLHDAERFFRVRIDGLVKHGEQWPPIYFVSQPFPSLHGGRIGPQARDDVSG
ncbi:TetR family transcriptional regulator [Komagataeibacter intermedius AF2]|uniref:TetR family transcriptional regulator n=1 Tax=Komagataeibacter intermedius AF2 TaxID=1458464 RepID=A0A0N1N671_9PROT|nr:TetR/AcrR family transcriptional regulator [Komagataeibacter intermedius]KPH88148.1 TetR family transcriptional regulator [Komagataeibacter intermedius AF2]